MMLVLLECTKSLEYNTKSIVIKMIKIQYFRHGFENNFAFIGLSFLLWCWYSGFFFSFSLEIIIIYNFTFLCRNFKHYRHFNIVSKQYACFYRFLLVKLMRILDLFCFLFICQRTKTVPFKSVWKKRNRNNKKAERAWLFRHNLYGIQPVIFEYAFFIIIIVLRFSIFPKDSFSLCFKQTFNLQFRL